MITNLMREQFSKRLLTAVREHDMVNINKLIKFDIDINYHGSDGISALMISCESGFRRGCEILLMCGADVNLRDSSGGTALIYAARDGSDHILVELLMYASANVDDVNSNGETALICACASKADATVITTLLKFDANIYVRDMYGETALSWTIVKSDVVAMNLLLDHGADPIDAFNDAISHHRSNCLRELRFRYKHLRQCASCKQWQTQHSERLRKCGNCRLRSYCGKSCQMKDWEEIHKYLCCVDDDDDDDYDEDDDDDGYENVAC